MKQASSSLVLLLGYHFLIALLLVTSTTTTTTAWLPEQTGLIQQRSSGLVAHRSSSWMLRNEDNDEVIAMDNTTRPEDIITAPCSVVVSRRNLFRRSALSASSAIIGGVCYNNGIQAVHAAYTIDKVEPNEKDIYATAQNCWNLLPGGGSPHNNLRVLWIGSGDMKIRTGVARNGVYKDLFQTGSDVTAFDLLTPTVTDLSDAQQYAVEQGKYTLQFQQGDATKLHTIFADNSFDVVVCSLFLCQDFDPVVVVQEIRQVLKPGGRFGFYEHIEDIDTVIVGKVFGESSIIKIEADPEMVNILAGVVQK